MIWGAIRYHGAFDLVGVKGNMDSTQYGQVLDEVLKESAGVDLSEHCNLMRDNVPVHTSNVTKNVPGRHHY